MYRHTTLTNHGPLTLRGKNIRGIALPYYVPVYDTKISNKINPMVLYKKFEKLNEIFFKKNM